MGESGLDDFIADLNSPAQTVVAEESEVQPCKKSETYSAPLPTQTKVNSLSDSDVQRALIKSNEELIRTNIAVLSLLEEVV